MKGFVIDRYGKGIALQEREVPEPEVRDHDVLVRVHAASANPLDAKVRDGDFKIFLHKQFPLVLGHDVAGVVERVGAAVQRFQVGDEVYARPPDDRIGGFAERIAIHEDAVAKKPRNLTMIEAASLPLVALTAWQALVQLGNVKPGHKVLIHAGSGGVGTLAIQLAKHLGAFVATTTSTANVELVQQLGADRVIDYKKDDFAAVLDRDFDFVLHSLDTATLMKSLQVLKPGGTLVSISGPPDPAFAAEQRLPWFLGVVMRLLSRGVRARARRAGVRYAFLFMRPSGAQLGEIAGLVESGAVRPIVERVFPFAATNEAMALVESGRARGKVVIEVVA